MAEEEDSRSIEEITQTDYSRPWSPRMMDLIAQAKKDLSSMKAQSENVMKNASSSLEHGSALLTTYFASIPAEQLHAKIKACFGSFDVNGDGTLEPDELESALAEMGKRPTVSELQDLFEQFDTDKSGTIELDEFEHMVRTNLNATMEHCPCRLCNPEKRKVWEEELAHQEQQKVAEQEKILRDAKATAHEANLNTPVRDSHMHAPEGAVKHLTEEQRKAFTPEEAAHIEEVMRGMADVKCTIEDSVSHSHSILEVCSGILVNYFASIPEDQLSAKIRNKFEQFDLDKSGGLDKDELSDALAEMGRKPAPEELQDMFEMFDADGNGTIEIDEFEHMVRAQLNISREFCPCGVCEQQRKDALAGKKDVTKKAAKDAASKTRKGSVHPPGGTPKSTSKEKPKGSSGVIYAHVAGK
eukprot:CAMPEP_0173378604 /NCGR_PEP_ID=MMETSP1356-20130122/1744_1 /TAXON_ID=77927 ORGANISM="Hemiselmis virescens, Strain PCC157" /NCGR_SAMPLE_ID=MMETSP1356 /ASSEMBLY_ACC=CAM_ASM_000847 /LENGTH=412 /DNA_ID=CAMNT_0014331725 /DNA_START=41 /DNA_END=1279 /DNA_ORIENTATION=+